MTRSDEIVRALGRRPSSSLDKWLRSFSASPGGVYTLTTTEAYRLYSLWCLEMKEQLLRAEVFAHEMKLLKYEKKVKQIRRTKRTVYMMTEPAALKLLAMHRSDPTPKHYHMPFDVRYYREMGLHFVGMQSDNPLSPFPPDWYKNGH